MKMEDIKDVEKETREETNGMIAICKLSLTLNKI